MHHHGTALFTEGCIKGCLFGSLLVNHYYFKLRTNRELEARQADPFTSTMIQIKGTSLQVFDA